MADPKKKTPNKNKTQSFKTYQDSKTVATTVNPMAVLDPIQGQILWRTWSAHDK